jgi:hypothetical protein
MAQWVSRQRTDGGMSVQIKWRMDGRWQSETFTSPRLAAEFRAAVEEAGHRWPDGWIRGEGWAVPEPAPSKPTFAEVTHGEKGYFARQDKRAKLGKIKPKTVHDYRRTYVLHLEEEFGRCAFDEIDADDVADWIDAQIETPFAAKTVRDHHGLLSAIMKHGALRMKLRGDNPCRSANSPLWIMARPRSARSGSSSPRNGHCSVPAWPRISGC